MVETWVSESRAQEEISGQTGHYNQGLYLLCTSPPPRENCPQVPEQLDFLGQETKAPA